MVRPEHAAGRDARHREIAELHSLCGRRAERHRDRLRHGTPAMPAADAAWNEIDDRRRSFWAVVHPPFINRELTKSDVREIIRRGLEQTQAATVS